MSRKKALRKIVLDIETKNAFQDVGRPDPALLDLSMICIYDSATESYASFLQEELPKLWPILESADMLIGFNSDHFDIPLLNKYYAGDLSTIQSLDILKEVKDSLGRRIGLNSIAAGTLGREKLGKGMDAITWWKQGKIDLIREYCLEDVKITKEVYEYALANKKLKYKEGPDILEFAVDTKHWEKLPEPTTLTYTLPF